MLALLQKQTSLSELGNTAASKKRRGCSRSSVLQSRQRVFRKPFPSLANTSAIRLAVVFVDYEEQFLRAASISAYRLSRHQWQGATPILGGFTNSASVFQADYDRRAARFPAHRVHEFP
jgi:hypothetical protein